MTKTPFTSLNPNPTYNRHPYHLTPQTAIETFTQYDLVLDCTDHPTSRYLISDACVLTSKPLVSASALKTEGQLSSSTTPLSRLAAPQLSEEGPATAASSPNRLQPTAC